MKLTFDTQLTADYKSQSQKARVLTEHWVNETVFCPNCGCLNIDKYPNNRPVADFFCSNCREDYELKSKQNNIGTKILNGAYRTKMERLRSSSNQIFFYSIIICQISVFSIFLLYQNIFSYQKLLKKENPLRQMLGVQGG